MGGEKAVPTVSAAVSNTPSNPIPANSDCFSTEFRAFSALPISFDRTLELSRHRQSISSVPGYEFQPILRSEYRITYVLRYELLSLLLGCGYVGVTRMLLSTYPQLEPVDPVGNDAVRNEQIHYPQVPKLVRLRRDRSLSRRDRARQKAWVVTSFSA
jgi:hypothetical protein